MLSEHGVTGRWPDFFRDMRRTQEQMNRLFRGLPLTVTSEYPPVNVWIGSDGAIVTAEIPGVKQDQVDITVYQNTLNLRGERDPEPIEEDAIVHRQERVTGTFARTVVLPFRIDADKVSARFERGVLMLALPRPASDKPRQIKIGGSRTDAGSNSSSPQQVDVNTSSKSSSSQADGDK
jgi:HSP20 family protein